MLDLGTANFQHGRCRVGLAFTELPVFIGQHAHGGHLQRLQLHFHFNQTLTEARIFNHRALTTRRILRNQLQAANAVLGSTNPRLASAFIGQQEFRAIPAAMFGADQIGHWHFHIIEEHLIHFMRAINGDDGAHGDAGRIHLHHKEGNAFLLLGRFRVGAHQQKDPIGVLRERRPGFLPIDDVVIALTHRARFQRGKVRPCAWFRKALAKPKIKIGKLRQKELLLFFRAERDQHWAQHIAVEAERNRRRRTLQFFQQDEALNGGPIALPAPFRRPMRHAPALGIQLLLPIQLHLLGGCAPRRQTLTRIGWQVGINPVPHFLAEGAFLIREA